MTSRNKVLKEIRKWIDEKIDTEDEGYTYETFFTVDGFKLRLELDLFEKE